jgi:uncharacterized membrane protein
MERVEKVIEVDCPVRTVYNQWTQFEEFPRFMAGVKEVKQVDDTHVRWHAEIWGKDEQWDAEITEQEPDKRISWKSISGPPNAGTVRFEPIGTDRTRVRLTMTYEPQGVVESVGDALGILSARVQSTLEDFKKFTETRGHETGAWRGHVVDGEKQPEHTKAVDESVKGSFPASDPPGSHLPDEPPSNAEAKWEAARAAERERGRPGSE